MVFLCKGSTFEKIKNHFIMAKPRQIGEAIISLRNAGRTYSQIAKELNCSKNTVNYHCEKANLTDIGFKKITVSDEIIEAIQKFLAIKGNTVKMAVKKFELSDSTIRKYKID